jgi:hypothetical protein
MENEREKRLWRRYHHLQMVNLSGFMGCKPAQATTVDVSETGFLIPFTESS